MADRRARERTPIPRAEVEYLKHLDRLDYDPSLPDWDELSAAERAHWENLYPEAQDVNETSITLPPSAPLIIRPTSRSAVQPGTTATGTPAATLPGPGLRTVPGRWLPNRILNNPSGQNRSKCPPCSRSKRGPCVGGGENVPCHKCQTRRLTVGQCQGLEESRQSRGGVRGPRGPRKPKNPADFPKSDKPQEKTKHGNFDNDNGGAGGDSGIST